MSGRYDPRLREYYRLIMRERRANGYRPPAQRHKPRARKPKANAPRVRRAELELVPGHCPFCGLETDRPDCCVMCALEIEAGRV